MQNTLASASPARHEARTPYRALAIAAAIVAFAGFARSYYLKGLFGARPLPLVLHVHGLIMSAWIAIFIVQTWLIAAHRVQWHRRLGVVAAVLAVGIIALGAWLTVAGVMREAHAHVVRQFHYLLGLNFVNLLTFALFVGGGLAWRRRPEFHKRLMVLAAVTLLAPASARIALLFTHSVVSQFLAFYACLGACVVVDTVRHQRLHPVFGWGTLFIVAAWQLVYALEKSDAWLPLVARIFGS